MREGYFAYLILRKWEFSKEYVQTIKRLLQELAVQECSNIPQWWRDHILEFPALSDLASERVFSMVGHASERVFSMVGHVVNKGRAMLKSSSMNNKLFFNSVFKDKNKAFKVGQMVSHFYFTVQ